MRILIGADTFPPDINGAARFTERLARGLAGRGHDVHVLAPSPDGAAGVGAAGDVTVHRVRSLRCPGPVGFRASLPWVSAAAAARLVRRLHPDVVHVQAHFSVGRGLVAAAHRQGVPLVATNHFMPENLFAHARVPRWLESGLALAAWRDLRGVYRRADVVTAPTDRAVALLARETGLFAVPLSCGVELGPEPDGEPAATDPTVLFVGRLDPEKRVDELLRAAALLPGGTAWRMEIVGDGLRRAEWEGLAAALGIGGRVTFTGFVDDRALAAAYRRCAVVAMPGVAELQSLVTLEAMAAGRPVLAADALALPHLVQHGHNGYLHPPGDPAALADGLARLLADPALRRRMGRAGRRLAAPHDLDATLRAFEDVYQRVRRAPVLLAA